MPPSPSLQPSRASARGSSSAASGSSSSSGHVRSAPRRGGGGGQEEGGGEGGERGRAERPRHTVRLKVFDLSKGMAQFYGGLFVSDKKKGVWHTNVLVFGCEYFYMSTICVCPIGMGWPGEEQLTDLLEMGTTDRTPLELEAFLRTQQPIFTPDKYDMFKHNCNHFSDLLLRFLSSRLHVPSYILSLPDRVLQTTLGKIVHPIISAAMECMKADIRKNADKSELCGEIFFYGGARPLIDPSDPHCRFLIKQIAREIQHQRRSHRKYDTKNPLPSSLRVNDELTKGGIRRSRPSASLQSSSSAQVDLVACYRGGGIVGNGQAHYSSSSDAPRLSSPQHRQHRHSHYVSSSSTLLSRDSSSMGFDHEQSKTGRGRGGGRTKPRSFSSLEAEGVKRTGSTKLALPAFEDVFSASSLPVSPAHMTGGGGGALERKKATMRSAGFSSHPATPRVVRRRQGEKKEEVGYDQAEIRRRTDDTGTTEVCQTLGFSPQHGDRLLDEEATDGEEDEGREEEEQDEGSNASECEYGQHELEEQEYESGGSDREERAEMEQKEGLHPQPSARRGRDDQSEGRSRRGSFFCGPSLSPTQRREGEDPLREDDHDDNEAGDEGSALLYRQDEGDWSGYYEEEEEGSEMDEGRAERFCLPSEGFYRRSHADEEEEVEGGRRSYGLTLRHEEERRDDGERKEGEEGVGGVRQREKSSAERSSSPTWENKRWFCSDHDDEEEAEKDGERSDECDEPSRSTVTPLLATTTYSTGNKDARYAERGRGGKEEQEEAVLVVTTPEGRRRDLWSREHSMKAREEEERGGGGEEEGEGEEDRYYEEYERGEGEDSYCEEFERKGGEEGPVGFGYSAPAGVEEEEEAKGNSAYTWRERRDVAHAGAARENDELRSTEGEIRVIPPSPDDEEEEERGSLYSEEGGSLRGGRGREEGYHDAGAFEGSEAREEDEEEEEEQGLYYPSGVHTEARTAEARRRVIARREEEEGLEEDFEELRASFFTPSSPAVHRQSLHYAAPPPGHSSSSSFEVFSSQGRRKKSPEKQRQCTSSFSFSSSPTPNPSAPTRGVSSGQKKHAPNTSFPFRSSSSSGGGSDSRSGHVWSARKSGYKNQKKKTSSPSLSFSASSSSFSPSRAAFFPPSSSQKEGKGKGGKAKYQSSSSTTSLHSERHSSTPVRTTSSRWPETAWDTSARRRWKEGEEEEEESRRLSRRRGRSKGRTEEDEEDEEDFPSDGGEWWDVRLFPEGRREEDGEEGDEGLTRGSRTARRGSRESSDCRRHGESTSSNYRCKESFGRRRHHSGDCFSEDSSQSSARMFTKKDSSSRSFTQQKGSSRSSGGHTSNESLVHSPSLWGRRDEENKMKNKTRKKGRSINEGAERRGRAGEGSPHDCWE